MTTTRHLLSSGNFSQDWTNIGLITAADDWSGVASIVGYLGDNVASSTTGVDPRTLTSGAATSVDVIPNAAAATSTAGGVAELQLTNPTIGLQGSGTADFPYISVYLDATGRQDVTLSYTVRDVEATTDNSIQAFNVQYRTSATGDWINVAGTYVADATVGPSLTQDLTFSGIVLPSDANNASELEVRFMTTNAVGNDEWLGVDDIVVASSAFTGPSGFLSVDNVSIAEGDSGITNMVFTVTRSGSTAGVSSVDYVVTYGTATPGDLFNEIAPAGTVTFADGESTKTITVEIAGDTVVEPNETIEVTLQNEVNATITDGSGIGTILNDDVGNVTIAEIQGAGHASLFNGLAIATTGIVTGVDTNGFYMQSVVSDGNDATSDGIFVFTSTVPTVIVGDAVNVSGTVQEAIPGGNTSNFAITQITAPTITVTSSGNALPDAVLISSEERLPPTDVFDDDGFTSFDILTDAADFYESLEGMRVTVDTPSVTSATNSFGETWVVASTGLGSTGFNERGGITISGNASNFDDYNPERIQLDDDTGLFAGFAPAYTQGDILSSVTGIMSYNFQSYELLVTEAVTIQVDAGPLAQESTSLNGSVTRLIIGTYNVENLDPTDTKFNLLAEDIVFNLLGPDILSLNEIQDADGAGTGSNLSGTVTAQLLIDAIVAAGGPTYQYVEVAPTVANSTGGEPNGNIRNGFLYNPTRVDYVAGSATLVSGSAFNGSRSPLSAQFEFNGQIVTAISVHSTSRGGSDPLFGANQPPANGGEASRNAQGAAIRTYVDGLLAANPDAYIAVMGDFNGFSYETAIENITAGGVMVDANTLVPEAERYSYVFEGNAQALDHILLTGNLITNAQFDAVHLNSEQPAGATRPTDHDPQLVSLVIMAADTGWTTGDDTRTNAITNNDINGLAGRDTLDMSAVTVGIDLNLVGGAISSAETGIDTVRNVEIFRLGSGNDFVTGSDGNDIVLAGDGADTLNGGLGRDALGGGAGDDIIRGGTGVANELIGGAGNDVYYSDAVGDSIIELAGEGTDLVNTLRTSLVLSSNVENLTYSGGLSFVGIGNGGDNVITGGIAADTLAGRDGNDTLVGGEGAANTLIGGLGNDVYTVSAIGDTIVESVGEGTDTVVTTLGSFRLSTNVENLTASASPAFVGVGNALDNVITGGALADTLTGLDGNDTLRGGTGSANTLIGGNGNDLYVVEAAGDTIIELSGGGTDAVETARTVFTLAAQIENLIFTGNGNNTGIGNAVANAMNGGAGNDFLAGLGGDDILTGGDGYDLFRFSETGNDTITDFVTRVDKILLSNAVFSHTATVDFVLGTAATGTNSAILYDQATGALAFDADGTGAGAAVSIANLGAATILAANDVVFY